MRCRPTRRGASIAKTRSEFSGSSVPSAGLLTLRFANPSRADQLVQQEPELIDGERFVQRRYARMARLRRLRVPGDERERHTAFDQHIGSLDGEFVAEPNVQQHAVETSGGERGAEVA